MKETTRRALGKGLEQLFSSEKPKMEFKFLIPDNILVKPICKAFYYLVL